MNKKILLIIALVIIAVLAWVFLKPSSPNVEEKSVAETVDYKDLTADEKLEILEGLKGREDSEDTLTAEEKLKILEGLSSQNSETGVSGDTGSEEGEMTAEEKLKILESLKSQ